MQMCLPPRGVVKRAAELKVSFLSTVQLPPKPVVTLVFASRLGATILVALPLFVSACKDKGGPPAPPPPTVGVLAVAPQPVPAVFEFTAEAQPSHRVEVRSLVQGTILERYFVEGSDVRKGDKLFLIDPAIYAADSRTSQAAEETARASYEQAKRDLARGEQLYKGGAISQRDYDVLLTRYQTSQADLAGSTASLEKADVDLHRTVIKAEISGRIGTANLLTGAQVPGPISLLATIDQLDPIYVDLAISDNERLKYEDDLRTGKVTKPPQGRYRVQLVLSDGSIFPHEGRINFTDLRIDSQTGSLRLRTTFRNPERRILPGQFVRARLLGATRNNAILVPQTAVQQALGRQFVYVVVGDTARSRDVQAGSWVGSDWIIEKGLNPGDKVIVDNIQRVRTGSPVVAKPFMKDSAGTVETADTKAPAR
jgi:membrane fusion protein (multidrug efflux system)